MSKEVGKSCFWMRDGKEGGWRGICCYCDIHPRDMREILKDFYRSREDVQWIVDSCDVPVSDASCEECKEEATSFYSISLADAVRQSARYGADFAYFWDRGIWSCYSVRAKGWLTWFSGGRFPKEIGKEAVGSYDWRRPIFIRKKGRGKTEVRILAKDKREDREWRRLLNAASYYLAKHGSDELIEETCQNVGKIAAEYFNKHYNLYYRNEEGLWEKCTIESSSRPDETLFLVRLPNGDVIEVSEDIFVSCLDEACWENMEGWLEFYADDFLEEFIQIAEEKGRYIGRLLRGLEVLYDYYEDEYTQEEAELYEFDSIRDDPERVILYEAGATELFEWMMKFYKEKWIPYLERKGALEEIVDCWLYVLQKEYPDTFKVEKK